jgi:phosphoribosylformimino-5-aminoimidazole carboxamide ribotide isomerase
MLIFAAIDLKNGKCVRLMQGDPNAETIYSDEPAEMAQKWMAEGTDWLHVVNLDGAFGNDTIAAKNINALQLILDQASVPVQFGGGLRSAEDVERVLAMGVSRVVIGSMAAGRPDQMAAILAKYGSERVALGLDVKNGKIATHGWQQTADTDPLEIVKEIKKAGLKHVIHTDISKDGMLTGVNLEATIALAQASNQVGDTSLKVIVSGGVAGIDDVKRVKANEEKGLEGLIIGKALYTGRIALPEAVRVARGEAA